MKGECYADVKSNLYFFTSVYVTVLLTQQTVEVQIAQSEKSKVKNKGKNIFFKIFFILIKTS